MSIFGVVSVDSAFCRSILITRSLFRGMLPSKSRPWHASLCWLVIVAELGGRPVAAQTVCLPSDPSCPGVSCGVLLRIDCRLPNGCPGIRRCLADGSGYGACECGGGGGPLGVACVNVCSGAAGHQTCNSACSAVVGCFVGNETRNCCDDNANGAVDEGLPNTCTTSCGTAGAWVCGAGGPVCVGTEVCNGCDDDLDGRVDNVPNSGNPISQACSTNNGLCAGSQRCLSGSWSVCGACAAISSCEALQVCGVPGTCRPTPVPQNQCRSPAVGALCTSDCRVATYCVPREPAEVCNGLDDDCNGEVDPPGTCTQTGTCVAGADGGALPGCSGSKPFDCEVLTGNPCPGVCGGSAAECDIICQPF
jgi:hypothetical protein